jgi:hypothetical protein
MVRRRSTVRFRKGAPAQAEFSNLEPSTSSLRVAIEWQPEALGRVQYSVSSSRKTSRESGLLFWIPGSSGHCRTYLKAEVLA